MRLPLIPKINRTVDVDVLPLLLRQGKIRFRIVSDSMNPVLRAGDLVELKPAELKAGEIVVFSRGEVLIGHRLVRSFEKEGTQWVVTKGERSLTEDLSVPAAQVIGRVTKIYKPRVFHRVVWRMKRRLGPFILPVIKLFKP